MADFEDFAQARKAASTIKNYWLKAGYKGIITQVVPKPFRDKDDMDDTTYEIMSNIGPNGFPPKAVANGAKI